MKKKLSQSRLKNDFTVCEPKRAGILVFSKRILIISGLTLKSEPDSLLLYYVLCVPRDIQSPEDFPVCCPITFPWSACEWVAVTCGARTSACLRIIRYCF